MKECFKAQQAEVNKNMIKTREQAKRLTKLMQAKITGRNALDKIAEQFKPIYGHIGIDFGSFKSLAART